MDIRLPFGRQELVYRLPDTNTRIQCASPPVMVAVDPAAEVRRQLAAPIGAPPLADLLRDRRSAAIVFADRTRRYPVDAIIRELAAVITAAGIPDRAVTLVCGGGAHTGTMRADCAAIAGADNTARFRTVVHDAADAAAQVMLGTTPLGTPVAINRAVAEAGAVILTGVIAPHYYAGFSGGRKGILPGVAGRDSIIRNHALNFHGTRQGRNPAARAANLDGNPIHLDMVAAARMAMQMTPSVYEHAARLIGARPWQAARDPEMLFQAHAAAYRRYRHQPVVVGIDIYNLEAEAYGAVVAEPEGNGIPAITTHPYPDPDTIVRLPHPDPTKDGRIPMVLRTAVRLKKEFPAADIRIPLGGPFSIASNLMGFENLLVAVILDPVRTRRVLAHLMAGQARLARAIVGQGLDVAFFESAAAPPLLGPEQFRDIELPVLAAGLGELAGICGHPVPCIIGGDTLPILDAMLETGTTYVICPAETDQQGFMDHVRERRGLTVRVNTRPGIIARGTWEEIRVELERVMAIIAGRPGSCVGTGALPYETEPENIDRAIEYLKDR
ncbi:MAG: lactate racemase domain-containing protein [Planctomycetota bacterium]